MLNFKKLRASEQLYVENGFATNKVYAFSVQWLNSVACKGNAQLRRRVTKVQLDTVRSRLEGLDTVETVGISNVLQLVDLKTFRPVSLSKGETVEGYVRGNPTNRGIVSFKIGGVTLDAEYTAALNWDTETIIHVRKKTDPIVITKHGNIVGLISPTVTEDK